MMPGDTIVSAPRVTPVDSLAASTATDSLSHAASTSAVTTFHRADSSFSTVIPRIIPYQGMASPWQPADSVKSSSDSVAPVVKTFGVVLKAPDIPQVAANTHDSFGMSCILTGLFLLFCIIGLRFRNNSKYIAALLRNLVEVRVRSNVFDETVRETSFMVLLNLLWSCSAGIVLCELLQYTLPADPSASFGIQALATKPALTTAVCMGIMVLYTCLMALGYMTVGTVFSDAVHARMWLKGFIASQGLLSIVFFPLALMLLYYPEWSKYLLWTALGCFLIAKFIFIWKGFRIFFTQFSSWVLFLYYLCSLEIVPLILTYWAACLLCSLM